MKWSSNKVLKLFLFTTLFGFSSQIWSAGYKVEFQSPSVMAEQGDAAVVEDAGTNWYNSAGLVYLPKQFAMAGFLAYSPSTFTGNVVAPSLVPFPFGSNFVGSGSASSHSVGKLPSIHYSQPINPRVSFGISMVPAWGFIEDYGWPSLVRYNQTRIYTKTIMISPSLAFKLLDQPCAGKLSIGVGPDFNYFSVLSRNNVRTEALPPLPTGGDSQSRFSADNWGYGIHVGLLYQPTEKTRVGINYRSKIVMDLNGYSDFSLYGVGLLESNRFNLKFPLPPNTTFSVYQEINPCWAVMGTVNYDQWNVLRNYHAKNVITPTGLLPDVILPQYMHNTWDFGLGTRYKLNEQLWFRGSVKYVATPTQTEFRGVGFPDAPKLGMQVGGRYNLNCHFAFDGIYGYVFHKKVGIHDVNPLTGATADGHAKAYSQFIGGQLVWTV